MAGTTNGQRPDTSFYFSNSKTIILCGYKNPDSKPTTFSEFTLSICGEDTILDFWEAMLTCRLNFEQDTLLVEDMRYLPTAINRKYEEATWSIEKIYFVNGLPHRQLKTNEKIRKYNEAEIEQTNTEYETAKPGLDESKMELANRLFMAAVSGDKKAREYFSDFNTKFGTLDGAFKEEYNELKAMLKLWENNK